MSNSGAFLLKKRIRTAFKASTSYMFVDDPLDFSDVFPDDEAEPIRNSLKKRDVALQIQDPNR